MVPNFNGFWFQTTVSLVTELWFQISGILSFPTAFDITHNTRNEHVIFHVLMMSLILMTGNSVAPRLVNILI